MLVSCKTTAPVRPVKVAAPPLPTLQRHVEPLSAAVPSQLPQINFNDPVDVAILQTRLRFQRGEQLYKQGLLKRAKEEFNSAVDLLLETSAKHPMQPRLDRELLDLVA